MKWDYLGNEWAVEHLSKHVREDAPRHAYLISGPSGIGKRTLGLRFAMALNCTQPTLGGDACGACRSCVQISKMQHPDLDILQADQSTGQLKVDQIRELQHHLALSPYEARYRIALLLNFERANPNAANALLKTLEEPPDQVILILTADSPENLLPTIVSRCEVIRLRPLSYEFLASQLVRNLGVEPERAAILAHVSNGCPGLAIRYQQQPSLFQDRQKEIMEHLRLLKSSYIERFFFADQLSKEKDKQRLQFALESWLSFWRDAILVSNGAGNYLTNINLEGSLISSLERIPWQQALQAVTAIQKTMALLETNVNSRLALEVLVLNLPHLEG